MEQIKATDLYSTVEKTHKNVRIMQSFISYNFKFKLLHLYENFYYIWYFDNCLNT